MSSQGDNLFDRLRDKSAIEAESKRAQDVQARAQAQALKAKQREVEIVQNNSTLPVVIDEVRVGSVERTRRGFLDKVFQPLIKSGTEQPYSLADALEDIGKTHAKLNKLDIFKEPIAVYINQSEGAARPGYPTPLSVLFQSQEASRYKITTGTEVGNADGSGYVNALFRNLFGGAETLRLDARKGLKTRSAQSAVFTTPILSNPDLVLELTASNSTNSKPWASHEEVLKGGYATLKYQTPAGHHHSLTYTGAWRQITSLAQSASASIRAEASDSFKSSLAYSWMVDSRKSALAAIHGRVLPSSGCYAKATAEVAGAGGLGGDVAFGKLTAETQAAIPIFRPESGFALSASLRGGLLHPLPFGIFQSGNALVRPSRFHDRFQLGGPTDVRGFYLSGIGPQDGGDALGGDVFAAGGVSLTGPFPAAKKDIPIRWQVFVNAGRLLGLPLGGSPDSSGSSSPGSEKEWHVIGGSSVPFKSVTPGLKLAARELMNGLPTTSAGFGVVYAHPLARFELNFSVPLVVRQGELGRKGVSFGVGLEVM